MRCCQNEILPKEETKEANYDDDDDDDDYGGPLPQMVLKQNLG